MNLECSEIVKILKVLLYLMVLQVLENMLFATPRALIVSSFLIMLPVLVIMLSGVVILKV